MDDLTGKLMEGIARFEGFYRTDTITLAQRNNNPGNIRQWGSLPRDQLGYAIFPNVDAGWAALRRQVGLNISRGLTLNEFFGGKPGVYSGYAPSADNNQPFHYAGVVAGWLGINPSTTLQSYLSPAEVPLIPRIQPLPSSGPSASPRAEGRKKEGGV